MVGLDNSSSCCYLVVILGLYRASIVSIYRPQHLHLKCIIFGHFGWQEKYPDAEPLLDFIATAKKKVNQMAVYINGTRISLYVNAELE